MSKKKYYTALLKNPQMTDLFMKMSFEIGEEKHIKNIKNMEMLHNSFYSTDNIYMLTTWYHDKDYDIFEVIPSGNIIYTDDDRSYYSEKIKIIRKLSESEINELYKSTADELLNGTRAERTALARLTNNEKYLDKFVYDEWWIVRRLVALKRIDKYLDVLVNDENRLVCAAIALLGIEKYLDILVYHEEPTVYNTVASLNIEKYLKILEKRTDINFNKIKHLYLNNIRKDDELQ